MNNIVDKLAISQRAMLAEDLEKAHALTQALRWPHRREDWTTMQNLAETIVLEHEGELIGTACTVLQGNFASIGLIIIADEFQGLGLGRQLMTAIMNKAGKRNLFLSATVAGKPLYEKLGFQEYGRAKQFQGNVIQSPNMQTQAFTGLRPALTSDKDALIELMNQPQGMNRDAVGEAIFNIAEHVMVLETENQVSGFACIRPFGRGYAIGPVVAQNQTDATLLIESLLAQYLGKFVRIDTPTRYGLEPMLINWGLEQVDDVSLMAIGQPPVSTAAPFTYSFVTQAIG
ncbi:GNAT family N-acetyltransferase [Vibrio porteresiae]|uniref:GNAT family N-acetyltransferase n=1 Tax=Vibrio porteresiae DSM 19223 TaxID=1123496 RepID=A0ABZ0QLW0_9VIBR|nr:GNAT family N-acetyltransferase [Vibrio porteresiae]WPC76475.1 GNAT family N-acetyltransferase [Vibrio porteresiae DSM 19223]